MSHGIYGRMRQWAKRLACRPHTPCISSSFVLPPSSPRGPPEASIRLFHPSRCVGPALAILAALSCGGAPTDLTPVVATVEVHPATASMDLDDTLHLVATALDGSGAPVADPGITWRSVSAHAEVDADGLVTALTSGQARIEAVAANGVVGSAQIQVTPVTAIQPDTGRYGQVVTIQGVGLPPDLAVYFSGGNGQRVRAFTRHATSTAVEVWVPVGAVDGPLQLETAGGSFATRRTFRLTAAEDVYAAADSTPQLPIPFHNPSLLARSGQPHAFRFTAPEAMPFSLHLVDRGAAFAESSVRAWVFRMDAGGWTLMSFMMTADHLANGAVLDSVAYSRASLAAGDYMVLVAAFDPLAPDNPDVRRPFGLRLTGSEAFERAPDAFEPNDYPAEGPVVALPFIEALLQIETPYAMDHYAFEVVESSTVTITAAAAEPWLLLYLMPDDQEDILAAWENDRVLAEADGGQTTQQIQAHVAPGRYTLLVWDWAGRSRPYDLSVSTSSAGAMASPARTRSAVRDAATIPRGTPRSPGGGTP